MKLRLILMTMLALPAVAAAQAPPAALSLPQAVELARTHSPALLAAQQHLAAVRANEITAGLRLNPQVVAYSTQTGLGNDTPGGPTFIGFGMNRTFETGGKRALRLTNARANSAVAVAQVDDQQRALDLAVKSAFTRMVQAKAALEVADQNVTGYRRTVVLTQVRLDAGDLDRTSFERVELQLAGFENDAANAQLAVTQASLQLQTLLGQPRPMPGFDIVGSLSSAPPVSTLQQLEDAALLARPDLVSANRQVVANDAAIRLADAQGKTDPQLGVEFEHSGPASTFGLNAQIPFRIFDRNQGERARTRLESGSSRLLLTQARNQVVSDVDQAYAAYQTAIASSQRYQSKYLAEAAHVRDNLEFAYRNGSATLLDYLSALQDYRQTNLAALNAQAQAQLALHQLSYATATEVNP